MVVRFLLCLFASFVFIGVVGSTPVSAIPHNVPYIAFGDSFSSGEGEISDAFYEPTTNTSTNRCHVSIRSYPFVLGNRRGVTTKNYACSGSRISGVEDVLRDSSILSSEAIISLGIGGNDVDIMGKLKTCLGPGTCNWAKEGKRAATVNETNRLMPKLIELVEQLKQTNPSSLILVGYPSVINTDTNANCRFLVNALLSHDERKYMDESVHYLNDVLEDVANTTGVTFVDTENSLIGERLCDSSEISMNSVRIGEDIAPISFLQNLKIIGAESFHPTPLGHDRMAEAIDEQLNDEWKIDECIDCHASLTPAGYWFLGASDRQVNAYQFTLNFLLGNAIVSGYTHELAIGHGTFMPNSLVQLELHSEVQSLGSFQATGDGSLSGSFTLPQGQEGYHDLHLIGQDASGTDVDVYQTVYIEPYVPGLDPVVSGDAIVSLTDNGIQPPQESVDTSLISRRISYSSAPPDGPVSPASILGTSSQVFTLSDVVDTTKNVSRHVSRKEYGGIIIYGIFATVLLIIVITFLFRRKV
jgi:lysophospholipase L1-like esterase